MRYDYGATHVEPGGAADASTREIPLARAAAPVPRRRVPWALAVGAIAAGPALSAAGLLWVREMRPSSPVEPALAAPPEVAAPVVGGAADALRGDAPIELHFFSVPAGARVYLHGAAEPLGVTPMIYAFARRAGVAELQFRKPGYRAAHRAVRLDAAATVAVSLTRIETAPMPRAPRHESAADRPPPPATDGHSQGPAAPPTDLRDPWAD